MIYGSGSIKIAKYVGWLGLPDWAGKSGPNWQPRFAATSRHAERRDTADKLNLSKLLHATTQPHAINRLFHTGRRIHCIEWISASLSL